MPELPEVETLRRGLLRHLPGRRIVSIELRLAKLIAVGNVHALNGEVLCQVRRRGKYLVLETDSVAVLIHLKLAGQLALRAANGTVLAAGGHPMPAFDAQLPHRSTHLILELDDAS